MKDMTLMMTLLLFNLDADFLLLYYDAWYKITYMKAESFIMRKRVYPNGDIVEIRAWRVRETQDKPHGFKYSLAYIREGKRVVGYDNAEGKGDHRHYKGKEYSYEFKSIDKLIEDFFNDVRRAGHED